MEYWNILKALIFSPTLNFIGLIIMFITYKIKRNAKNNSRK